MPKFPQKRVVAQYDDDNAHFDYGFGDSDRWFIYAGNTFLRSIYRFYRKKLWFML